MLDNIYMRRFKASDELHVEVRRRAKQVQDWSGNCLQVAKRLGFESYCHRDYSEVTGLHHPRKDTDLSKWTRTRYQGWRPKRNSKAGHQLFKEVFSQFEKLEPIWDILIDDHWVNLPGHDFILVYKGRVYSANALTFDDVTLISVPWLHIVEDEMKQQQKIFQWEPTKYLIEIGEVEYLQLKEKAEKDDE